ncbi:MAG: hypothetical protein ACOH10_12640 [Rhodoglobus sp.]
MSDSTGKTEPARQIALIRSIANYAEGHEAAVLIEIRAVLDGASVTDLLRARLEVSC